MNVLPHQKIDNKKKNIFYGLSKSLAYINQFKWGGGKNKINAL